MLYLGVISDETWQITENRYKMGTRRLSDCTKSDVEKKSGWYYNSTKIN